MANVQIDEVVLAEIQWALTGYKFKLCEPPRHDGRQDVWLAAVARRDAQLECVKRLLEVTKDIVPKRIQPSKAIKKAFG